MRDPRVGYALMSPFAGMVLVLLLIPVLLFVTYSFLSGGGFAVQWQPTIANYQAVLNDAVYWRLMRNSLVIACLTTVISLPLGYLLAHHLRFKATIGRGPLLGLTVVAIIGGYLVRIYAWRIILGSSGVLNSALMRIGLVEQPIDGLLFSRSAVVVALVNFYVPFVAILIYGALQSVDPRVIHAARDLGADGWAVLRRVLLPLTGRAIFAALAFVFLLTIADYITPQLLGGTDGAMVGVAIFDQFVRLGNWPRGAAMSVLLVLTSGSILAAAAFVMGRLRLLGTR